LEGISGNLGGDLPDKTRERELKNAPEGLGRTESQTTSDEAKDNNA